jgi:tRNA A-37 threonylcarbamoyl transferase component Bud32
MKTIELTSGSLTVSGTTPRAAQPVPAAAAHEDVFDGRRWTFRAGFDEVLRRVPAAVWLDPAAQGWECVKRNSGRSVWRAAIAGRTYFLKYYHDAPWRTWLKGLFREPACAAEWRGGLFALDNGIATVPPAGFTTDLRAGGRSGALLVTEAVEPVWPLNAFWELLQTDDDAARRRADADQLAERLAELIARAHQAGFQHTDMHAENILVQRVGPRRYRAVFVDLHSARLGVPISDRAVISNLAQLNQWFRRHAPIGDRLRFLRAYLRWRDEYEHAFPYGRTLGLSFRELVAALADAAGRHARRLWLQRDRRLSKQGRYFGRVRLGGGWRAQVFRACKHPAELSHASQGEFTLDGWRRQLQKPLRWFADMGASCKDSHSADVRRVQLTGTGAAALDVIVKRPRPRNGRRRVRMLLPPSRSRRAWKIGNALLHREVPTARPLACVERRWGPLVLDNYLITEAVPDAADLCAFLRTAHAEYTPRAWVRLKRDLVRLLARRLRQLHERGFVHLDCKGGNILVVTAPELQLLWIDLDGLRCVVHVPPARELAAIARLHLSLTELPGLTRTDRVRFLRAYFTRFGSGPDAWRRHWTALAERVAAKQRSRAARQAWKLTHYGRT